MHEFTFVKAQLQVKLFWYSLLKLSPFFLVQRIISLTGFATVHVSTVHVRIIADTSITYDWQGIRYSRKKKVTLRIRW